jgi:hypothetical protein
LCTDCTALMKTVRRAVRIESLYISMNVMFKDEAYLFYIRTQCVPRCKLSTSVIKTNLLMSYNAKVAVCSEIRTKHINAMWAPRRIF